MLELGAKGIPKSTEWLNAKVQIQKNDPLLKYMYEARNDDEHGLGSAVSLIPELHEIGVASPGFSNSIRLENGPFFNVVISGCGTAAAFSGGPSPAGLRVTSLDGKPVQVRRTPATTVLVAVSGKKGERYDLSYSSPWTTTSRQIANCCCRT